MHIAKLAALTIMLDYFYLFLFYFIFHLLGGAVLSTFASQEDCLVSGSIKPSVGFFFFLPQSKRHAV